jgi:hypothetical protein
MSFMQRNLCELSIFAIGLIVCSVLIAPAKAEYNPKLGRFLQRDPNETAHFLIAAIAKNAESRAVYVSLVAGGQYQDGINLFQAYDSNPLTYTDPTGEFLPILLGMFVAAAAAALYKSIDMTVSGEAAYQDLSESYLEIVKAGGIGALMGLAFMGGGAALGTGLGFLGVTGAAATAGGGMSILGAGLGGYQIGSGAVRWWSADNEYDSIMGIVDMAFGGTMTLGAFAAAVWLTRPPPLPKYAGGKVSGVLRTSSGDFPLSSGVKGPAQGLPKGTPGMDLVPKTHVEGHAAALMRSKGIPRAILYMNRKPCTYMRVGKLKGCDVQLEDMLPQDAVLEVIVNGEHFKTYHGRADSGGA